MIPALLALLLPLGASAQQTLTLDDCHQMAVENSHELEQARTQVEMSGYDKKIALANYFPEISATGAYMYNSKNIALISDDMSANLTNLGTIVQSQISAQTQTLMQAITSNPAAAKEYMGSAMWQTVLGAMGQTDVSNTLNALGTSLDEAFHPDMHNIIVGAVSLTQPVFVGGKIVSSNRMAKLAETLAETKYDAKYQDLLISVDQAYWQVVSVAAKKSLAESYSDLLHKMEHDVDLAVQEGVATQADALTIKVKANEADLLLTKATNGLVLSKMLLCKQVGLPLDSEIVLADEAGETIAIPQFAAPKDFDSIFADRTETRSLDLAAKIYDQKVNIARADMLPQVALTANYLVSNPSMYNGFQKEFGGNFTAGVMVSVPIFHGFEAMQKTRKAKAEASLYRSQYEEAKELITLQVSQLMKSQDEALERVRMTESNLECAEENLRMATIGFEEGVVDANTALGAQTAWLQAHSDYIDAGVELQMTAAQLKKAEGNMIEK